MTIQRVVEAVAIAYLGGVISGHAVVSAVKAELVKLHTKLDQLLSKIKVNVFTKGN